MLDKTDMVERTLKNLNTIKGKARPIGAKIRTPTREHQYLDASTYRVMRRCYESLESRWNTLIDVGASSGLWGCDLRKKEDPWQIIFFEPNEPAWGDPTKKNPDIRENDVFVWKAAWDENDRDLTLALPGNSKFIGEVVANPSGRQHLLEVNTARVDTWVRGFPEMPKPYWLKIDGHGSDWKIIEGCSDIWNDVVGINFEANMYKITPTTVTMLDMIQRLETMGFRLYYMGNPVYQLHGGLWEMECVMLRRTHPFFGEILEAHRNGQRA